VRSARYACRWAKTLRSNARARIVFAVLALLEITWDRQDLGDGLVLGSDGSVSGVWELGPAYGGDFLSGSLPAERTPTGR
jgi:hypothetical protein